MREKKTLQLIAKLKLLDRSNGNKNFDMCIKIFN